MLRLLFSVYALITLLVIFNFFVVDSVFRSINSAELDRDLARDFNGIYLLLDALSHHESPEAIQSLLEEISENSNLPMILRSYDSNRYSQGQENLAEPGSIHVEDYDNDVLSIRLNQDYIVDIGPLGMIEDVEKSLLYTQVVMVLITAFFALMWVAWQHYKIRKLVQATVKLSQGYLDTRAPENFTALPDLNRAFNVMAERIQRLFDSHKLLTNAISHELRSPIARAQVQLELINADSKMEESIELIGGISDDVREMEALVDELLSFARLERREFVPEAITLDLSRWVAEKESVFRQYVGSSFSLKIISKHCVIDAEPTLLYRLILNLLTNAGRFCQSRVWLSVISDADTVVFAVDDDGPGIPKEHRLSIFEPFTRLDASRDRKTGGHGLGLAIAAQIARAHGAKISIEDSPLGGARFVVRWPSSS